MAAIFIVALIDIAHTESAARNATFEPRLEEILNLKEDFQARAWLYALAQIVVIVAAIWVAMRADGRERWRRDFVDLGIFGVCVGLVTVIYANAKNWGGPGAQIEPSAGALFAPTLVALTIAAAGGIVSRLAGWGRPTRTAPVGGPPSAATGSPPPAAAGGPPTAGVGASPLSKLPWPALAALAFTGLTVLLAWIFMGPQPSCGGGDTSEAPGWTDAVAKLAFGTTVAALLFGFVSLAMRRWFVALISFVVNPSALILMAGSTCAFY